MRVDCRLLPDLELALLGAGLIAPGDEGEDGIAPFAQGLDAYDPEAIHCSEITFDEMREVTAKLRAQTAAQRLEDPVMHAGRADVIGSGATVVEQLMTAIEKETGGAVKSFVISEKDILDGIVAGLL